MRTSTIELVAALVSIIAGYYVLTIAIIDSLNFFTFNPNDYTRLKYDLYSYEKQRKNTFYIALAVTIITNLILFIKTKNFEEAYLWTISSLVRQVSVTNLSQDLSLYIFD